MSEPALRVFDDPAAEVARLLADTARGGATIALTGGTTVGPAYERAAVLEPDWSRASVWWTDERCVAPDDERSNYGLVRRSLLDRLAGSPAVHRIRGELPAAEAAAEYDAALEGVELDLVLLSLGRDAHVASLFPASPQLAVRDRRATSGPAGLDPAVDRVTMTLPELLSARRLVVLATGAAKGGAVARAFGSEPDPTAPASLLRTGGAPAEVFLDRAAAARL